MALSRLGLPRAAAAAGQFRARRVDHAARQSGVSRLRRFPARGVGPHRPRARGSVPRLFPAGRRPRTLLLRSRLPRPDLTSTFSTGPEPERDRETLWGGRRGMATSSLYLIDGVPAMP